MQLRVCDFMDSACECATVYMCVAVYVYVCVLSWIRACVCVGVLYWCMCVCVTPCVRVPLDVVCLHNVYASIVEWIWSFELRTFQM